jgi:5'-3' exonuclease
MFLILDCNYVSYVCAFALSRGMSYRGSRTEVIYGFMKQLFSLFENFEASQVVFCWDSRVSKRREIYPEYKSNRHKDLSEDEKESRELVYDQFDEIKKNVLPFLGFANIFEVSGYESDDLIASLVKSNHHDPGQTIVISSDADLYQLLGKCSLYSITKAQTTDIDIFKRHYGISPEQWVEVKAIAGCSTDHVKGVVGIGEKKAIAYLTGKLARGKMLQKILESQGIIKRNIPLVELPFAGTPTPKLRRNSLMMDNFMIVAETYGMASFLEKKNLIRWEKIISRID